MKFRLSPQTLQVLEVFLDVPVEWRYGYDISRSTGLKSGTLYPILMRMAERGLWEATEPGRPARHLYRLTQEGLGFARQNRRERRPGQLGRTALGGVES